MVTGTVAVFRVEDEQGRGPFRSRILSVMNDAMTGNPDADWHIDMPDSHEAFGEMPAGHVCGTASLRDMVRWFPRRMRRVLGCYGYGLSTYRMPADSVTRGDGGPGDIQVMFAPVDCVSCEWTEFPQKR